ncbi:MAG: methylmalonyl Co-A mutase-associated GTPase MeaB [Bacteroidia bacterium]|jgi:LAO/AO transport system kinase
MMGPVTMVRQAEVQALLDEIQQGSRRALSRAITWVESRKPSDQDVADFMMDLVDQELVQRDRSEAKDWTMAITGPPGAGKSTFIDLLGCQALDKGHRVAVLAVDPSSAKSGGSILGDKTRMQNLAGRQEAFVRPSPAGTMLGGTARATQEAMDLCRYAGFDWVLVETVGVGQNETEVSNLVDWTILLLLGRSGDELQGIKRGIVEAADAVLINKADGVGRDSAAETCSYYRSALSLFPPHSLKGWSVPCQAISALEGLGMEDFWSGLQALKENPGLQSWLLQRRSEQRIHQYRRKLNQALWNAMGEGRGAKGGQEIEEGVRQGLYSPASGVRQTLQLLGLAS